MCVLILEQLATLFQLKILTLLLNFIHFHLWRNQSYCKMALRSVTAFFRFANASARVQISTPKIGPISGYSTKSLNSRTAERWKYMNIKTLGSLPCSPRRVHVDVSCDQKADTLGRIYVDNHRLKDVVCSDEEGLLKVQTHF